MDFFQQLVHAYETYKTSQIESFEIIYDRHNYIQKFKILPNPYQPLRIVQIYFDTATYDEIVKDVSVTLADQLGAIGGTMGLFAGFSFLSALEIVYFVLKHLVSALSAKLRHYTCRVQGSDQADMC